MLEFTTLWRPILLLTPTCKLSPAKYNDTYSAQALDDGVTRSQEDDIFRHHTGSPAQTRVICNADSVQ
jgi:hypothetical protein